MSKLRTALRPLRPLKVKAAGLAFRGNNVICPNCGSTFRRFGDVNGPNRECWTCGSLERHRSVKLYLERHPEMLPPGIRVLHVAPERSLRPIFTAVPQIEYVKGDLSAYAADLVRVDVTDIPFPDDHFDVLVCNHVLEHVPDDGKAMREISRVLKPTGWALLLVPDVGEQTTDEDHSVTDPRERERRWGQWDHVRRYGWDYVDRLAAAGLDVEVVDPAKEFRPPVIYRHRLEKFGELEPLFFARPRTSAASPREGVAA
jgi:SAM-dependent methyltransferase